MKPESSSTIPPLLRDDGYWAFSNQSKADLFAVDFPKKWCLPRLVRDFVPSSHRLNDYFVPIRLRLVVSYLQKLDINTAAGPDGIGPIVLKRKEWH